GGTNSSSPPPRQRKPERDAGLTLRDVGARRGGRRGSAVPLARRPPGRFALLHHAGGHENGLSGHGYGDCVARDGRRHTGRTEVWIGPGPFRTIWRPPCSGTRAGGAHTDVEGASTCES